MILQVITVQRVNVSGVQDVMEYINALVGLNVNVRIQDVVITIAVKRIVERNVNLRQPFGIVIQENVMIIVNVYQKQPRQPYVTVMLKWRVVEETVYGRLVGIVLQMAVVRMVLVTGCLMIVVVPV
jgi:hypothetical protein